MGLGRCGLWRPEALREATNRMAIEDRARRKPLSNEGYKSATTQYTGVDVWGKKDNSDANNFDVVHDLNNGLEYLGYIDGGILLTNTHLQSTGGSSKVTNVLSKVNGVGGWIGKVAFPVTIIANCTNDEISSSRAWYNGSTAVFAWGIGYYVGGIPGFGTGVFFTYITTLYDGFNSFTNQMGIKMSDFNQSTINGILRK